MKKRRPNELDARIIKFVYEYTKKNGYAPLVREIAQEVDTCDSTVSVHVTRMTAMGLLESSNRTRSIKVTQRARALYC